MKLSVSLLGLIFVLFLYHTRCFLTPLRLSWQTKPFATIANEVQAKNTFQLSKKELYEYAKILQIQKTPDNSNLSTSHAISSGTNNVTTNFTRKTNTYIPFVTKLQALNHYHEHCGSVNLIPSYYITPTNDSTWPTELQGIYLGGFVYLIRKKGLQKFLMKHPGAYEFMKSLDFQWEHQYSEYQEYLKHEALQHYYTLFGHSDVPRNFVVTSDMKNWPPKFHSMKLGAFAKSRTRLRSAKTYNEKYPKMYEKSKKLKFNWRKRFSWSDWYQIFEDYFNNYGNLDIETTFRVPFAGGNWTEEFRGANLGTKVNHIRRRREFIELTQKELCRFLNDKEFRWSVLPELRHGKSKVTISKVMEALLHYNATQGPINFIGIGYKINSNDSTWPKEFQGISLGTKLDRWRKIMGPLKFAQAYPEEFKLLEALNFQWHKSASKFKASRNLEAMQVYNHIYGDINNIPICFIVNIGDEKWPSKFHGLRLGQSVFHLRKKGKLFYKHYNPDIFKALQEMRFVWKLNQSIERRFYYLFHALEHYYILHGNLEMNILYKVLINDPHWPKVTNGFRGLKLGLNLETIKYERNYIKLNFPKLFKLLKGMGLKFKRI